MVVYFLIIPTLWLKNANIPRFCVSIIQKNLHINLSRELWFDDLILFSEIRNSLIHNRGTIDCETIKKLQGTKWDKSFTAGKKFDLSVADFNNWTKKVKDVSESIYKAVLAKYHNVVE